MVIDTPCIGICSSVYGDPICRGCKRSAVEVIDWNRYTPGEKEVIYQRLHGQIENILLRYIDILDESVLQEKITQLNIRLHPRAKREEQAFHLLRLGAKKIKDIRSYGLAIKPEFANLPLMVLFNQIDKEIYLMACTSL
jgi:predicted Fe-S protein YdhL (DUF1289 family)